MEPSLIDKLDKAEDERDTLRTLLQSLLICIHRDQRVIENNPTLEDLPGRLPLGAYRTATDQAVDIILTERGGAAR